VKICIRSFAAMALAALPAVTMAAHDCFPMSGNTSFLPSKYGGFGSVICGLPRSQNPILGSGEEQERRRTDQLAAWSRSLKEHQEAIPVKAGEPMPPASLKLPGALD